MSTLTELIAGGNRKEGVSTPSRSVLWGSPQPSWGQQVPRPSLAPSTDALPQDNCAGAQHCSPPRTKRVMNLGKLQREKEHLLNLFYMQGDRHS